MAFHQSLHLFPKSMCLQSQYQKVLLSFMEDYSQHKYQQYTKSPYDYSCVMLTHHFLALHFNLIRINSYDYVSLVHETSNYWLCLLFLISFVWCHHAYFLERSSHRDIFVYVSMLFELPFIIDLRLGFIIPNQFSNLFIKTYRQVIQNFVMIFF